jgi:hypothetical protein
VICKEKTGKVGEKGGGEGKERKKKNLELKVRQSENSRK